jgi:hypothetical protein
MNRLPEALAQAKAERHRKWFWCRSWNGFADLPAWRLVATRLGLPVHQVVALVYRLDSLANAAEPRGYVGEFSPAEFGAALDMPASDAARIFEALSHDDVRWIDGEHLATFHKRNPDREDLDAASRQRRSRARKEIKGRLEKLHRMGMIAEATRWQLVGTLDDLPDDALTQLLHRLRRGQLSGLKLSTEGLSHVTPAAELSTADMSRMSHVTRCDIVTVTPRADDSLISPPVDKSGDGASGETGGPPKGASAAPPAQMSTDEREAAVRWLDTEGVRIVTERTLWQPGRAATNVERWGRDLDDPMALVAIILGADGADLTGARFHVSVTDQLDRALRARSQGLPLPLPPVPIGRPSAPKPEQPASVATADEPSALDPLRKLAG